jgi:hypothetical protein
MHKRLKPGQAHASGDLWHLAGGVLFDVFTDVGDVLRCRPTATADNIE